MGQPKHRITGMGVVCAAGVGLDALSARLFEGRQSDILDQGEPSFFKLKNHVGNNDVPFIPNSFAMAAVVEALNQAGLTAEKLNGMRVGVVVGSTVACTNFDEDFGQKFFGGVFPDSGSLRGFFYNNTAQFISRKYELKGPVQMLSNACTSGADAIGVAASWLDADLCDAVICGGTEWIIQGIYYGFRSLMLCSPTLCKPFDKNRQGLTLGEGAAIVVLEKESSPRRSLADFLGYGSASDAFHPTSPDPEGRGLDLAVRMTIQRRKIALSDIDFVNAHGTGTPHNDVAEGRWISRNTPNAILSATKGYTGHALGAAGAIEAVITALCLRRGELPVSLGFETADPEIGLEPTRTLTRGDFKTALSLSLGFGGLNAALCLGKAE